MLNGKKLDEKTMTRQELADAKSTIEIELLDVKTQIDIAKSDLWNSGIPADHAWWVSVNSARVMKTKSLMLINKQLSSIPREKRIVIRPMPEHLIDVCREFLPKDDFDRIMKLAQDRVK